MERIPPSPQVPSPDNAVATPPTSSDDLRDGKPRGNTAHPWCTLRREMRSPAGEDSGATSPLYALHSRSRYEFSSDTSGLTTLGVYTAPYGRNPADRDAAYIVIPHAPPAPLIGHSDHPVLGPTGASTTSQVDVKCLAKADRGDRWCYHPGQETADDLLALQDESRKAVSGGAIFNSTPPTAKGQPPHSMARVASYMLVPGQSKTVTMAYSNKKATDLPCLLALGQRRLLEVQEAYPNDTLHLLFGAYVHRDVELCGLAQHLHRDLDREANKSHPAFSSFTAIVGSTPPDHEQQGFFVPRSACGLPCPWVELPMPATPGKSLTIDSFIAHCGGVQPPGLDERGCVAVFGFSTKPFLDYSKMVAVY